MKCQPPSALQIGLDKVGARLVSSFIANPQDVESVSCAYGLFCGIVTCIGEGASLPQLLDSFLFPSLFEIPLLSLNAVSQFKPSLLA